LEKVEKSSYEWKNPMTYKEVAKMLKGNGWVIDRQNGSHVIFKKNNITCTVPNHKEIKVGTLNSIRKMVETAEN
jgi:predicted RNA binding protein YcfA (HicA-like mRNA interferase family)